MNKSLSAALESFLLISVCIGLVAFIGLPTVDRQSIRTVEGPPPHHLSQGIEPWDKGLVLPTRSDRIANYTMNVSLDISSNTIRGWEILEWRNTTGRPQREFPFHMYHNAWKNNRSTYAKENGYSLGRSPLRDEDYGYTNVKRVVLLGSRGETDITGSFRYIQPDDGNVDDQTVCQVMTPGPVLPGQTMRLRIEFETKQPIALRRTGALDFFHFAAQWFPKIGVWWKNAWSCHQFHYNTEFFADYGVYDVSITLASNYVIGASGGIPKEERQNSDGTKTVRFYQEDVHDFAWVTSPNLVRTVRMFRHREAEPGERPDRHHPLRDVTVILLSLPHHGSTIERYFDATFKALRYYGEWYGEYPYETITVVDPPNSSHSTGMEYPTLFTGGANMFAPKEDPNPESVTVHEFGHQFWYGLVGNNEFEEAWLDEGFNSYSQDRVMQAAWPPFKETRMFFGGSGAGTTVGIPHVFSVLEQSRYTTGNLEVRNFGKNDVMARNGWEYNDSYRVNAYTKPAMSLWQLEFALGEERMYRVMRTYHHRYRFKHPTTGDFINTVNELGGRNMNSFFENTWFSSNLFDYSVDAVVNRPIPPPAGHVQDVQPTSQPFECTVIVKRLGEAVSPVDLLVVFENGAEKREAWDGEYRWKKFVYLSDSPVAYAVVDPDRKIILDVNYNNNSKASRPPGFRSLSARKLASKWMFWVQNYLEFGSFWY